MFRFSRPAGSVALLTLSLAVAGCGGGGGGSSSSSNSGNSNVGAPTAPAVSGSSLGSQAGAIAASGNYSITISEPSPTSFTLVSPYYGGTYDFQFGTRDPSGPNYAQLYNNGSASSFHFPNNLNIFGYAVTGACSSQTSCTIGPTLLTPPGDVITAWQNGWTGKGVNILMNDDLSGDGQHVTTTTLLAGGYAIGAGLYGLDFNNPSYVLNIDGSKANPSSPLKIGVINASFGGDLTSLIGHAAPWTDSELHQADLSFQNTANQFLAIYNGVTTFNNITMTDAVITKAAGNDSIPNYPVSADYEPFSYALLNSQAAQSRLILVGALHNGTIASYSEIAGPNSYYNYSLNSSVPVFTRFLVADDTTPFGNNAVAVNGLNVPSTNNVGTSYAAPRVAGYAAILRQEFPNLTGANTASVLLDTASYSGLTYAGNSCTITPTPVGCQTTYGMGQANLGAAMAPVGHLR